MNRQIHIGSVRIGGGAPLSVQSMTNTRTEDSAATIGQVHALASAGCDIVRVAVPGKTAVSALPAILEASPLPVVADIHFDYRLALHSITAGVHGIRINPGNIGKEENVRKVAEAAGEAGIPIRVGANSGSLPAAVPTAEGLKTTAERLVDAATAQCALLEKFGFSDIKVSLKASDVMMMVEANKLFAAKYDYPLHLGVTEAGTLKRGIIKSAVGIGILLNEGIGDTIRVSLTADPVEEVRAGIMILEALGLRRPSPEIISCPTCGRTEINLMKLAEKAEQKIEKLKAAGIKINAAKIAVMGCVVNGPGEASDADFGIAGSKNGMAVLFKKGEKIGIFPENEALEKLMKALTESE